MPAENYDAFEKYRRFLCIVASNLTVILWVDSSVSLISIYVLSSWRPNSANLWWMYGWLEGVNMEIIIGDRICQNFPFKFHRNLYRLCNFSRLLPLSKWIQVLFSALRDIKLPRQSCLSFNMFYGDAVFSGLTNPESVLLLKTAWFCRKSQFGPPIGR